MNLFPEYSHSPSGSTILLAVKPRFAELIVAGSKRIELRRAVPTQDVGTIALYSSSPTQAVIALVDVIDTIEASPSKLWELAKENWAGVTRAELRTYFDSKRTGFAFMLGEVRVFKHPLNPKKFFRTFTAPQSFKYLNEKEHRRLVALLEEGGA